MRGGNVSDFVDHTTYEECAVRYQGVKYFFHGLIFDTDKKEYSYVIDIWDNCGNYIQTIFNQTASSADKCLKLAQNAPVFNGKTFWEAEPDMEWVEW